jgi:hypothetical protein
MWSNPHNRTIFPMQLHICNLETAFVYFETIPQACEACKERAWNRAERVEDVLNEVIEQEKGGEEEDECGGGDVQEALENHFEEPAALISSTRFRETVVSIYESDLGFLT